MENQHRKISGYRELSQAEIDLMNEIKAKGAELEALCDKVKAHIVGQVAQADIGREKDEAKEAESQRLNRANPTLWEYYGRTGFQLALMQLTRAVAQPTTF